MKPTLKSIALVAVCCLLPMLALGDEAVQAPLFLDAGAACASSSAAAPALPELDLLHDAVPMSTCNATANCGSQPQVMCSGNSSCSSQDRACPGINGWVTCDGVTTVCTHNQSCLDGCAADWEACVAQCPPGILNPCRIACSEARGACHCNC
ncbi:MAG TPA: hypothetical protein VKU40_08100 [Thermoanaerobaculia bacterium]|nr:hypothetical protein [Thermoanaerobaculia bacterium]